HARNNGIAGADDVDAEQRAIGRESSAIACSRSGPIEVVSHVLFAAPEEFHRAPHSTRDLDGLHHEVGLVATAEATANENAMHLGIFCRHACGFRRGCMRNGRTLRWRPYSA